MGDLGLWDLLRAVMMPWVGLGVSVGVLVVEVVGGGEGVWAWEAWAARAVRWIRDLEEEEVNGGVEMRFWGKGGQMLNGDGLTIYMGLN